MKLKENPLSNPKVSETSLRSDLLQIYYMSYMQMKDATYIKRLVHKKTTPDRSFWMSESVPVLGGTLTNDMKTIKLVWHIDKKSFIWDGCNNADAKKCTTLTRWEIELLSQNLPLAWIEFM